MSTAAPPPTPQPQSPPKRARKRIYIPIILLVLLLAAGVGFFVRGTWADDSERNPKTPDDGTITQLFRKENGNLVVRCGVVVDAPPKDVWATVTDYNTHSGFLPYIKEVKSTKQADGRDLIQGVASSRLWGEWPIECLVKHSEKPEKGKYSALWSEDESGEFVVSRGGWSLSPIDNEQKQTLLVFTLQVELKRAPNFMVRNIIMDRLHSLLKGMRDESVKRSKAKAV